MLIACGHVAGDDIHEVLQVPGRPALEGAGNLNSSQLFFSVVRYILIKQLFFALTLIATISATVGCGNGAAPTRAERQLIARADAICANSRRAMRKVEEDYGANPALSFEHNVDYAQSQRQIAYAQALLDISMPKVEHLSALQPPTSIRDAFGEYVDGERQIYYADLTAVHAAHSVHTKEYSAALVRHRKEQHRSLERADEIGLVGCAS